MVSVGHHPLIFAVAACEVPHEPESEYHFAGAIREQPIRVIEEEVTGLPIPADNEMVIAGWCPPNKSMVEGPFGEWTGYYASGERLEPIIEVERIYYRSDPIILGSPPDQTPHDYSYFLGLIRSALLHNWLEKVGYRMLKASG